MNYETGGTAHDDQWTHMRDRIRLVVGDKSSEEMGRRTGISGESVRRYLTGHMPSVRFLAALCESEAVSGTWLLTGQGTRARSGDAPNLEDVATDALLAEVGRRLDAIAKQSAHQNGSDVILPEIQQARRGAGSIAEVLNSMRP